MKNKTWKFTLICSLIVMGFTACDDDDEYYYVGGGSSWLSYGNLEKIDNGSRSKFAIRRDDGNRLIVTEGMPIRFDGAKEDLRVYAHYSIVGSERDESGLEGNMNYYVRLYGLDDVLTKVATIAAEVASDKLYVLDDETGSAEKINTEDVKTQSTESWADQVTESFAEYYQSKEVNDHLAAVVETAAVKTVR